MFGKKKKTGGYDEEELRYPEEQPEGWDAEDGEYPGDAVYDGYTPEGYGDYEEGTWGADDEEDREEPEKKPEPRSIFRPETRKPNFVVSVLLNTVRVLLVAALLAGVRQSERCSASQRAMWIPRRT